MSAHHGVARGEVDRVVQVERAALVAGAGQRLGEVRHLDEAEPDGDVPQPVGDLLASRPAPRCATRAASPRRCTVRRRRSPAAPSSARRAGPARAASSVPLRPRNTAVPGTRGISPGVRCRRGRRPGRLLARAAALRPPRCRCARCVMTTKITAPSSSGIQPPSSILSRLAPKKARSTTRNTPPTQRRRRSRPAPDVAHGVVEQRRGQQHRGRDRGAVGAGQPVGAAEPEGERDRADHHHPVHERHVDLAVFACPRSGGCVRPGNQPSCIACRVRENAPVMMAWLAMMVASVASTTSGHDRPARRQPEERVAVQRRVLDQQRGLAGIAEQQRRQHDAVPGRRGSGCGRYGPCRRRAPRRR